VVLMENDNQLSAPFMLKDTNRAELIDKIRPDIIVETMRHRLMGEDFKNGAWEKIPALQSRAVSEVCAWDIANLMLAVSSQNVSISNLKDVEIKRRACAIADAAMDMCLKNWKEYGIHGIDQLLFINEMVFSNTFITLKHPLDRGIQKLLTNTTSEIRSVTNQEPKATWLNRLASRKSN